MSKEFRNLLTDLAIVVIALVLVLPLLRKMDRVDTLDTLERVDTIYVRDTICIVEPQIIKEEVVRYEKVYLHTTDTIVKIDSIEVIVPIVERVYEDTAYKAVVRGYEPELVSLDIYRSTITKTITKKEKPKFVIGAGVYGGFGSKGADYGLGVMVGVPIWSW